MTGKFRRLMRDVWALARPYWSSEERWSARGLLAIIVILNLGLVGIEVALNNWNRQFFNAIQEKDGASFLPLMLQFTVLASIFIVVAVYRVYLRQWLQIRWRRWLTEHYIQRWLEHRNYYRLQLADGATDNPDQRIAEDYRDFVESTLVLGLGLMSSVVTLASFVTILWVLSGTLEIPIGGMVIPIPGYMVWAALVYAILGSWLTHKVGRQLIPLIFGQQRFEADFRFSLVRFRENVESIALYGGEAREGATFGERFAGVVANWYGIMRRQMYINFFTTLYGQLAIVFPYVVAGPRYFADKITLGELTQTAGAFGQVQSALSWFVDAYPQVAQWKATVDRLTTFMAAMNRIEALDAQTPGIRIVGSPGRDIVVRDLDLGLPTGDVLLPQASLVLRAGQSTLLTGPSGSGKSTLFRAIAGIWPYGSGTIERPADARLLFLPQKPYLPIDTLRAVLTYPEPRGEVADALLTEVLQTVSLPNLVARLDEREHWAQMLSPGEQQRIAFARALISQPDWLFLDEASSALDEVVEGRLYQLLPQRLPATTIVSIGHRPSLRGFHARVVEIRHADGTWGLHDVPVRAVAQ
jgi:putative ATP-binding cassette transporter